MNLLLIIMQKMLNRDCKSLVDVVEENHGIFPVLVFLEILSEIKEPYFNRIEPYYLNQALKKEGKEIWWYTYLSNESPVPILMQSEFKQKECFWKNGVREGKYKSGKKQHEEFWKNDKLEGKYTQWYENGNKMLENFYKDGNLDGKYTSWYENGNI